MTNTDKVTHIAINCQVLINRLNDKVADSYFKQKLKQTAKSFLQELFKVEKEYYDVFFDKSEDSTIVIYDTYNDFMQTVASVPIYHMENITAIIQAYQKDPKSIEGIVKKINKTQDKSETFESKINSEI